MEAEFSTFPFLYNKLLLFYKRNFGLNTSIALIIVLFQAILLRHCYTKSLSWSELNHKHQ